MDPPIVANDLQAETVLYEVPYQFFVADGWQDMVQGGGGGGGGGSRAWAQVS